MGLLTAFKAFFASESAAITVDWVVLCAAIVGLVIATMTVISGGTENLSGDVASQLSGQGIASSF